MRPGRAVRPAPAASFLVPPAPRTLPPSAGYNDGGRAPSLVRPDVGGWDLSPGYNPHETLEPRRLLATLAGTVYDDPDLDGVHAAGEAPVPGVTVFVDSNNNRFPAGGEPTAVTDAAGAYTLDSGAATGDLQLRVYLDPFFDPWGPTAPAGGLRV